MVNGEYSFNGSNFYKINLENNFKNDLTTLKLNLDYANSFRLGLINFEKSKKSIANFFRFRKKKKSHNN